ncbi:uncharacterized protein H6S33_004873 [Morchella sextelata]|uniref:uncharacterized protein n=1 Tax=Morchella sextelata TaxID=1174677 RepID=UPI001D0425A2|nr:uncharacterized protein H6S33_004873 [Morchella sextelata]KAH0605651.1 hypothetical protein H6S33_004873 [Morchella sextelata]
MPSTLPSLTEAHLSELTRLSHAYVLLLKIRSRLYHAYSSRHAVSISVLRGLIGTVEFPVALMESMFLRRQLAEAAEALLARSEGLSEDIHTCEQFLEGDEEAEQKVLVLNRWRCAMLEVAVAELDE